LQPKILIYGYGNPGRRDDGLGPELVKVLEKSPVLKNQNYSFHSGYQLELEDAYLFSEFSYIILADASKAEIKNFALEKIIPGGDPSFSMHSVSASYLLCLAWELFGCSPDAYFLHLAGYDWEIGEEISSRARENLEKARIWIENNSNQPGWPADFLIK